MEGQGLADFRRRIGGRFVAVVPPWQRDVDGVEILHRRGDPGALTIAAGLGRNDDRVLAQVAADQVHGLGGGRRGEGLEPHLVA